MSNMYIFRLTRNIFPPVMCNTSVPELLGPSVPAG